MAVLKHPDLHASGLMGLQHLKHSAGLHVLLLAQMAVGQCADHALEIGEVQEATIFRVVPLEPADGILQSTLRMPVAHEAETRLRPCDSFSTLA